MKELSASNQPIKFNKEWTMATVRNIVKTRSFLPFSTYPDCKVLCINPFDNDEDDSPASEYEELSYVVPRDWLATKARDLFYVGDVDKWLREDYTSEESEQIFSLALAERQVIMVDFI